MANAKVEFLEHTKDETGDAKVKCAFIQCGDRTCILIVDYTEEQYQEFLKQLDFKYDDGYGGQELFGTIWYVDGTWSQRHEYDGSESWDYMRCFDIPNECLTPVPETVVFKAAHNLSPDRYRENKKAAKSLSSKEIDNILSGDEETISGQPISSEGVDKLLCSIKEECTPKETTSGSYTSITTSITTSDDLPLTVAYTQEGNTSNVIIDTQGIRAQRIMNPSTIYAWKGKTLMHLYHDLNSEYKEWRVVPHISTTEWKDIPIKD